MSTELLQACRNYLERTYRHTLDVVFSNSLSDIAHGRPVWRNVSDDDLVTEVIPPASGAAGLLLDPEIGPLCYLLPFGEASDIRKQTVRALALRSELSVERNYTGHPTDDTDPRGAWRVVIHWLVPSEAKASWIGQVMAMRRDTGFSEEVSMDGIFLREVGVEAQLADYAFPRLLLTTREVFRKTSPDDVTGWMSADNLVQNELVRFAESFYKPEQKTLAEEIVRIVRNFRPRPSSTNGAARPPATPMTFRSVRVQDFRNLRDCALEFGADSVGACVVHGPNGTGKSSLCEAMSIGLFASSTRYRAFASRDRERDIAVTDRAREYIKRYLTPLDRANSTPKFGIDDAELSPFHLAPAEECDAADLAMSGTILTQDMSLDLARMSAQDLGARILRGYSELADEVEGVVDSRFNQADSARQDFLRRLSLTTAITRIDIAFEKIAKREIDRAFPSLPLSLVAWFEAMERAAPRTASPVPAQWNAWGGDYARSALASEIARNHDDPEGIARKSQEWLEAYNAVSIRTAEVLREWQSRAASVADTLRDVPNLIRAWGQWLETQRPKGPEDAPSEADAASTKALTDLQHELQELVEKGKLAASHVDHLTRTGTYVQESWSRLDPNTCPTCGTNHAALGGIGRVIQDMLSRADEQRENLRKGYLELKLRVDRAQSDLARTARPRCPVTDADQSRLSEGLQWLLPTDSDLKTWISAATQREHLLEAISLLQRFPPIPPPVEPVTEAHAFAQRISHDFREATRTFEAPSNWKPVRDKLTEKLAAIVRDHLPSTLAKLWCELVLSLTPAQWLLPERPQMDVIAKRGETRLNLLVKERLARYIFNQSELHILGLGWFFTRYLTHGRFCHAAMLMDDPAHELDQTAFRDLCRLWETLIRLHRVYNRPLRLIVMLNQESRAVEAARRATGGTLTILV